MGISHRGQQPRTGLGHGGQHRAAEHRLTGNSGRHHARTGGPDAGDRGGTALADRVAAGVASIWPSRPRVVPTGVPGEPVLRGAMLAAVAQARAGLLASVADPQ